MQLYFNDTHPPITPITLTAPTTSNNFRQTHSNTNTNTGPNSSFNNRNSYLNISNNGQRFSTGSDEPVNTIRATRRTTVTIPANTTDPDIDNTTTTATNTATTNARTTPGSAAATNSRIRIETMASGDENDVNLFNALFAALINPSRLGGGNNTNATHRSNGLTPDQITDNSTVMSYDNNASANSENQLSSTICSICTLEYEPQQQVRSLDICDHCFHTGCIDRWLADHNTCPLCRAQVIPATNPTATPQRTRTSSRIDLNGID